MQSSTITIKGQVTIPAALRERFRILPGTSVTFRAHKDGILIESPVDFDEVRAKIRAHMATHHPEPVTREEIDRIKTADLKEKYFEGKR